MIDNLPIDTCHYLITVHTGVGKEAGTTSNISFVVSGESSDSGVRRLADGKIQVSIHSSLPIIETNTRYFFRNLNLVLFEIS